MRHSPDDIIDLVCQHYRMQRSDFARGTRHGAPRAALAYLLRIRTRLTWEDIAALFNGSHKTWCEAYFRFRRLPREEQLRLLRPFIELEHPHCEFEEIGPDEWRERTPRVAHEEAA